MRGMSQWLAISGWWMSSMILAGEVDYIRDIKPLLATHCYSCHGALKQEGGLRVDTAASLRRGGESGDATAPTETQESLLIQRVASEDPAQRMPPEGKALSQDEVALLAAWIKAGARAPADEQPQADPHQHWAFQPPRATLPPALSAPPGAQPIDQWLNHKAMQLGVEPLGPASKRELIRRVTLDLIGLPPTPAEIAAFEADESLDAYPKLVDSLLSRPEYGERWGRHWMDVWRYSDWYGRRSVPDVMNSYPQIWRWRDWIVRSLNEDKGYDRMLMEMVAADELCPTDDANIVATGFIVRNWYKWNYETWMKDCVEHTGKAFLGLTLNCAQCHDHKFDPITQEDYFRFRAFFEPLELRHDRVSGEPDPGPFKKYVYAQSYGPIKSGAIRIFDEKLDAQTFMFRGGDARNRIEGKPPVDCGPPRAFTPNDFQIQSIELPAEAAYPGLKASVRADERAACESAVSSAASLLSSAEQNAARAREQAIALKSTASGPATAANEPAAGELLKAQLLADDSDMALRAARAGHEAALARLDALSKRIAADDAAQTPTKSADDLARLAHMAEQRATFHAAEHARLLAEQELIVAERQLAVGTTGAADKPATVEPLKKAAEAARAKYEAARTAVDTARGKLSSIASSYTPLSPKYPAQSTGRRTALARWLVDPRNPLTARVAVNHIWMRHFGAPLVESVDNFGVQGKQPTHPELLDWLAIQLIESNWSMKSMHRLIVTSDAYRRSSVIGSLSHPSLARDRDNVSLWHFPTRRMEAEVVRDSVLACAGALDQTLGGPEIEVDHWVSRPRRSMYFTQHGESQMLFLSAFDGANPCECYRRSNTVLPSQALALSNSELLVHYGRVCAGNLHAQLTGANLVDPSSKLVDASSNLAASSSHSAFIRLAFETLLGRSPSENEMAVSVEFLEHSISAPASESEPAAAANGQVVCQPASTDPVQRARENLVMALFNHNDFVTIR